MLSLEQNRGFTFDKCDFCEVQDQGRGTKEFYLREYGWVNAHYMCAAEHSKCEVCDQQCEPTKEKCCKHDLFVKQECDHWVKWDESVEVPIPDDWDKTVYGRRVVKICPDCFERKTTPTGIFAEVINYTLNHQNN